MWLDTQNYFREINSHSIKDSQVYRETNKKKILERKNREKSKKNSLPGTADNVSSITLTTSQGTLSLLICCKLYSLHRYNTRQSMKTTYFYFHDTWLLQAASPGKEGS